MRAALLVAGTVLTVVAGATPAGAATTGSSYSTAARGQAGALAVVPSGTGLLGATLVGVIQPLADTLNSLASSAAGVVVAGFAGDTATNSAGTQSAPGSGYPTCGSGGWTSSNCYAAGATTVSAPPLLSLGLGVVQGYAAADATSYASASRVVNTGLTVLGIPLGTLGTITSTAVCGAATCTGGSASLVGTSLFNGAVGLTLASGNLLQVSLNGAPAVPVSGVSGRTISYNGSTVTLSADGTLLRMSMAISLNQLLNGLGLGGLLAGLASYALDTSATTVALTLTVGPGTVSSAGTSVTAYGLDVGVDLSGTVNVAVSGLLSGLLGSVAMTIPAGPSGAPNLLDLKLAYTNAASGQPPPTGAVWIPPGLI